MNENIISEARAILGNFIKEARKERQLSQKEVADMVGINVMTLSKIENGKFNFGIDIFNKLSIALGFKLELIMKDIEYLKGRFDLVKLGEDYLVLDKLTGIRVKFQQGSFNDTQRFEMPEGLSLSVSDLASILRMIGDWLVENHKEVL